MLTQYRVDGGPWQTYQPQRTSSCSTTAAGSLSTWAQAGGGSFELLDDGSGGISPVGGLGMLWYPVKEFGDFKLKFQFREGRTGRRAAPTAARSCASRIRACRSISVPTRAPGRAARRPTRPGSRSTAVTRSSSTTATSGEPQKTGSIYNFDQNEHRRRSASRAKGEWNDYEIEVIGQNYTVFRNGDVINEFDNTPGI